MAFTSGFLVVEDEPQAAESIARLIERFRPTETALTAREAKARFGAKDAWTGMVADLGLWTGRASTSCGTCARSTRSCRSSC